MRGLRFGSTALLSCTALGLVTVQAAERDPAKRVEEVVVTGLRQPEQLRDFAGSISLVKAEDVTLVGSTHHNEILNRAPGAMIQRNSGQESLTAIRSPVLSGPGSCGVFLFLENSVPIRPTGFCNVNELFEVNSEQAGSIEVLRGPAGVLYGSGAMHGAINIITAAPADLPARSLALEGGPDEYYRGKLGLSHTGQATDIGGVVVATHDGGWRASSGIDEQKLNIGLVHRRGDALLGLNLAATNLEQETAGFIQGFNAYRNETIAESNPNPEAYRDAYAVRLTGSYEQPLSERVQLSVRPYARYSRMDFIQHFLIGKPFEENGQESMGVLTALDITAFNNTRLLTGVDVEFAQGFLKETQPGPATDGAPAANAIRPAGKHYDYQVDSRVAAMYGQIEQPFAQRWKAIGGVRYEYVDYDYDNRMISGNTADNGTPCGAAGCLFNRPADRSDNFDNVTSKLGLSYEVAPDHTLYLTATRGYRAPDTSELYRLQRQQSVADLDSERLDSFELGARGAFGLLSYSLAGFQMDKENVIFRDANAFNVSDGRTEHEGVEYEFAWQPIESLSLALAGTYAKHTYDFDRVVEQGETIVAGRDVDTAPRHINTARLNWSFLPAAAAELEWVSVGSYFVDASNNNKYGGHDLLNLRVSWRATENWRAIARLNNVTDRAYADRADFAFGNYRYFPGRGRTLFVELRYETD
ncbi:TonB-dependent receptor [Steroidobacter sp. S1-65]|uniref:TonB-dependent receptor n=1 Tax=Steroidobacter gossypii TaxID=2805490 RepID=A0ABS1X2E0_9GAMM|nr:TonB-dependent receptor [Steroidobacter gossypii]MBM0107401.1 TonB-dependent receptor [Steroidobacter gossypii]